jgi:hypothetical protein
MINPPLNPSLPASLIAALHQYRDRDPLMPRAPRPA